MTINTIILKNFLSEENKIYLFGITTHFYNNYKLYGGRMKSYDIRNYDNGIGRVKKGSKFEYYYIKTNKIIDKKDLDRINKLKIPPMWSEVWVSINPKSNIQAVGVDNKGRKQYRYHEQHIKDAEKNKFLKLIDFIKALPKIDNIIKLHKQKEIYSKYRVITIMLSLVRLLHIRVGKEQYARENKSYGLCSLKKKHVKINKDLLTLNFKGKSNQRLNYTIKNKYLKSQIELLLNLGGEKLFQYIDENDNIKKITDSDLNNYIQEFMGENFTMKDFRTYAANYHFIEDLIKETIKHKPKTETIKKKNILNALKKTAHHLRHTRNISKKSYVMNFCIDLYKSNPKYFITNQDNNIDNILLDILKQYKKNILHL